MRRAPHDGNAPAIDRWFRPSCRLSKFLSGPRYFLGMSDACIPGVACLASCRAAAFTKPFQTICDRQASDEFYVLVADLPRESHAQRSTVGHWKLTAVHAVTEKRLGMQASAISMLSQVSGSIETYTMYLACGWTPTRCKTWERGTPIHSAM